MRNDGIEAVGARRYRNGQAQFQLEPVASQSWWGQAYMVDKISPNWNRTNLSISKTWWGQVPMCLYAPARLFQVEPAGYIVVCLWYSYPNRPTKSSRCSKSIFSTAAESFRLYPSLPFASLYATYSMIYLSKENLQSLASLPLPALNLKILHFNCIIHLQ